MLTFGMLFEQRLLEVIDEVIEHESRELSNLNKITSYDKYCQCAGRIRAFMEVKDKMIEVSYEINNPKE